MTSSSVSAIIDSGRRTRLLSANNIIISNPKISPVSSCTIYNDPTISRVNSQQNTPSCIDVSADPTFFKNSAKLSDPLSSRMFFVRWRIYELDFRIVSMMKSVIYVENFTESCLPWSCSRDDSFSMCSPWYPVRKYLWRPVVAASNLPQAASAFHRTHVVQFHPTQIEASPRSWAPAICSSQLWLRTRAVDSEKVKNAEHDITYTFVAHTSFVPDYGVRVLYLLLQCRIGLYTTAAVFVGSDWNTELSMYSCSIDEKCGCDSSVRDHENLSNLHLLSNGASFF